MAETKDYSTIFGKVLGNLEELSDEEGQIPESYIVDELELAFEDNEADVSESEKDNIISELISALELNGYIVI